MNSPMFQTTARVMLPLLVALSLLVLYRGHNLPGGGFIGGLLAASGFALVALAYDCPTALRRLRLQPETFIGAGLLIAAGTAIAGILAGGPFFDARWMAAFELPGMGEVNLGTPLLFDAGVYITVIGFTLKTLFRLMEPEQ